MSPPDDPEQWFVASLEELATRKDRGALAALRRGLGKRLGEVAEPLPYVYRALPSGPSQHQEESYYLVATLFACWHQGGKEPGANPPTNLGASFALLRDKMSSGGGAERRFTALLNCHREDLPEHLRHAVSLLKSREVPVDWAQLLRDLQGWDRESRRVQRDWARAFWGAATAGQEAAPAAATEETEAAAEGNEE